MSTDKALANFGLSTERLRGGDTGRGRVERRSFESLRFTPKMLETGYKGVRLRLNFIKTIRIRNPLWKIK